jgi:hypothetical protein
MLLGLWSNQRRASREVKALAQGHLDAIEQVGDLRHRKTQVARLAVEADTRLTRSANFGLTLPTGSGASSGAGRSRMPRVIWVSAELSKVGQSGAGAHRSGRHELRGRHDLAGWHGAAKEVTLSQTAAQPQQH